MKTVTIDTFANTPMGTFSRLRTKEFQCYTLELPWRDNLPWVSCIPEGDYKLKVTRYNRGGYLTWEVCDVPGRSHILFHVGNTGRDIRGCIAPGYSLGAIGDMWAVINSRKALDDFLEVLNTQTEDSAELRVRRHWG